MELLEKDQGLGFSFFCSDSFSCFRLCVCGVCVQHICCFGRLFLGCKLSQT
jgi:hypothetical protein